MPFLGNAGIYNSINVRGIELCTEKLGLSSGSEFELDRCVAGSAGLWVSAHPILYPIIPAENPTGKALRLIGMLA